MKRQFGFPVFDRFILVARTESVCDSGCDFSPCYLNTCKRSSRRVYCSFINWLSMRRGGNY